MGLLQAIFGALLTVKRQNTPSTYATYAEPEAIPSWPATSARAGFARVAGVLNSKGRGSGGAEARAGRQPPSAAAGRPGKAGSSNAGRTCAWVGCAGWGRTPAALAPAAGSARTVRQIGRPGCGLVTTKQRGRRRDLARRPLVLGPGATSTSRPIRRPPSPVRRGRPCCGPRPACGSAPVPGRR